MSGWIELSLETLKADRQACVTSCRAICVAWFEFSVVRLLLLTGPNKDRLNKHVGTASHDSNHPIGYRQHECACKTYISEYVCTFRTLLLWKVVLVWIKPISSTFSKWPFSMKCCKIAFQIWHLSGTIGKLPFYITAGRKCFTQIEMQNCGSDQIGVEFDVWPSSFSCHTHQPPAPFLLCLSTSVDILIFVVFPSTAENLLSQYRSF